MMQINTYYYEKITIAYKYNLCKTLKINAFM